MTCGTQKDFILQDRTEPHPVSRMDAESQPTVLLKSRWGPGYRIYFGFDNRSLIVLLLGGDKSRQESDIQKAQIFWQDYLRRRKR